MHEFESFHEFARVSSPIVNSTQLILTKKKLARSEQSFHECPAKTLAAGFKRGRDSVTRNFPTGIQSICPRLRFVLPF
jgi:hypothetical protein